MMRMEPLRDWTPELLADMAKLAGEGQSAKQIAISLGQGLTRSAVIGKCRRAGIQLGGKNGAPKGQVASLSGKLNAGHAPSRPSYPKPAAPKSPPRSPGSLMALRVAPVAVAAAVAETNLASPARRNAFNPAFAPPGARIVPLVELANRGECRWPLYDDGPHLFCAAPITTFDVNGKADVYCTHHLSMSRSKVEP